MEPAIMATEWQAKLQTIKAFSGMTWEDIAQRVGVDRVTIHRIKEGETDDPKRNTRTQIEALYKQAIAGQLKKK